MTFELAPTPVHRLARLGAALGLRPDCLWIKRDDLTLPAGGGNKARKLRVLSTTHWLGARTAS